MNTDRAGMSDLLVSVVTAVRDASAYIEDFIREADEVLRPRFKDYEILIVDNGSRDDTVAKIEAMQSSVRNIQLYCLATPIRREIDILAGVDQAIGDIVITMDAVYDPLQLIPQMVDAFQSGAEIVYGLRRDRLAAHGTYQRAARFFFSLHRSVTKSDIPGAASGYRLMSRRVVNSFVGLPNRFELFPVITAFTGFRYATIVYDRVARAGIIDRADYFHGVQRAIRIMLLGSHHPLRLLIAASFVGAMLSLLYSIYVVVILMLKHTAEGWATLSLQISGLFFLLFMILAAMNEYIFHIFLEQQRKEVYMIARESSSSVLSRKEGLNLQRRELDRDESLNSR